MKTRDPAKIDRSLRLWLWQEEQRWRRAALSEERLAKIADKAHRDRDRVTAKERCVCNAFAKVANAGTENVIITPATARQARTMLSLGWPEVAELIGVIPSVVLALETGTRWTTPHMKLIQRFYEAEGLVFAPDGVSWVQ